MSESSWAFSPQETFFKQISGRVAGWLAAVRSPVLVNISNKGPNPYPEISGPWDQLMASSHLQSHSLAAFTAGKFTHQKGALMSSLLEFAPCLAKYHPVRCKSVHVHHPRGSVSSTDTQLPYILTSATSASAFPSPFVVITRMPTLVMTPVIPIIIVTDVDGPLHSGVNDSCNDRLHRSRTCGAGFLWSQWRGKFSPSRPESEFGSGGGVYLEDQPEEDIEEAGDDNEDYFEGYDGIIPSARHQLEVANFTSEKLKLIIPEPKELEWWEIEGGDDGSCDEGSEDDEDDESDSEFDEDEDEDQESDYENGDDEREDDSDDDDSGEDSDLGESEDNNTILGIANPPSGPGALVPYPYQKPNSSTIIHTYAKGVGLVNLDAQDIEKGNDGPPTHPNVTDSDLGSCSSCTNVLPTPVIHSPLCILPVGNICLIGDKGLPGGRPHR